MTQNKDNMKNHLSAGLDITAPVFWINHLGQAILANVALQGRFYVVRDMEGNILQSGGHGAKFTFSY